MVNLFIFLDLEPTVLAQLSSFKHKTYAIHNLLWANFFCLLLNSIIVPSPYKNHMYIYVYVGPNGNKKK